MTRWFKHAVRPLVLAGALLGIESAAKPLLAQACLVPDGVAVVSLLAVPLLGLFDIVTAPASARQHNERTLTISPYESARGRSYGVSVSWFYGKPMPVARRPVRVSPAVTSGSELGHKSPGTAFALSFLSTAAPMAAAYVADEDTGGLLLLGGIVVGPSVGHFYAGRPKRGLKTAALRAAGTALFISALSCNLE